MSSMVEDCAWGSLAFHHRKTNLMKMLGIQWNMLQGNLDVMYRILHWTAHTQLITNYPSVKYARPLIVRFAKFKLQENK